jgi:hypothetical protein
MPSVPPYGTISRSLRSKLNVWLDGSTGWQPKVIKEKQMRETTSFNQVLDKAYDRAQEMRCVHPGFYFTKA